MCVLHSIRFTCSQLHRVADIPLVEVKVKSALELCSLATEGTQEFRGLESVKIVPRRLPFVAFGARGDNVPCNNVTM